MMPDEIMRRDIMSRCCTIAQLSQKIAACCFSPLFNHSIGIPCSCIVLSVSRILKRLIQHEEQRYDCA